MLIIPMYGIIESYKKKKEKWRKIMKPVRIMLCRGKGCCPEILLSDEGVEIKDDAGGKVHLTRDEVEILKEKLNCHLP